MDILREALGWWIIGTIAILLCLEVLINLFKLNRGKPYFLDFIIPIIMFNIIPYFVLLILSWIKS